MSSESERAVRELFLEGKSSTDAHKILLERGFKCSIQTIREYYVAFNRGYDSFKQYKYDNLAQRYENDPEFSELCRILEGSVPICESNRFIAMLEYLNGNRSAKMRIFVGTEGLSVRKKLDFIDYLNDGLKKSGLVDIDTVGNTRYITCKGHEILQRYAALSVNQSSLVPAVP